MSTDAEYVEDAISNCCSSSVIEPDVCAECLEHCSPEFEPEAPDETPISKHMEEYAEKIAKGLK